MDCTTRKPPIIYLVFPHQRDIGSHSWAVLVLVDDCAEFSPAFSDVVGHVLKDGQEVAHVASINFMGRREVWHVFVLFLCGYSD